MKAEVTAARVALMLILLPCLAWAAVDRGGDVDQRYPKDVLVQHGGPVYDVKQPPLGRLAAKGDGQIDDTAAIQKTIDACAAAGGGRVLLPAGRYLSGTLRMRSRVELHLTEGACLIGAKNIDAYAGFQAAEDEPRLPQSRWHRGLIVGERLHDIAFTGPGTIDGNQVFDPQGEEKMRGPHTILLGYCRNVTLRDLTIRDSANYAFLFLHSQNVRVETATFEGGWDGVHFRGSPAAWNRDVRITGCRFYTGDDSIAGGFIEDAIVEKCVINSSCNGVRLIGPARRLNFSKCEFFGPGKFPHRTSNRTNMLAALNLQPSAWGSQPGPLEDVSARDLTMRDVSCAFHVVVRPENPARRLTFERVAANGVYRAAASVESWDASTFDDVLFRDIQIEYTGGGTDADAKQAAPRPRLDARKLPAWGFFLRGVKGVTLDDVQLTARQADRRPVLMANAVERLRLEGFRYPPPPEGVRPLALEDVKHLDRD